VQVEKAGKFDVAVTLPADVKAGSVRFRLGKITAVREIKNGGGRAIVLGDIELAEGAGRLEAWIDDGDGAACGVWSVNISKKQ
jgi:hypothetical protein